MKISVLLYAAFLAAALVLYRPVQATELDDLIPVEMLWVEADEKGISVAGKDVQGFGRDWVSALRDLERTASGTVFLETVERIAVAEEAADCLPELLTDERLRPSVQLYLLRGSASEELEAFAKAHPSEATAERPENPPVIIEEEGRYYLG